MSGAPENFGPNAWRWNPDAQPEETLEQMRLRIDAQASALTAARAEIERLRANRTAEQERADVVFVLREEAHLRYQSDYPDDDEAAEALDTCASEIQSGAHVGAAEG